jgi:hypothetical protein
MSELPEGLGGFDAGRLSFAVDDGLTRVRLEEAREIDEQSLDRKLAPPPGAPLASWLLARLTRLCQAAVEPGEGAPARLLEQREDTVEVCEGGVYVVDFVLRQDGRPAGKVQLQAGRAGAALLGVAAMDTDDPVGAFVAALQASPTDVAFCSVQVRDPDWPEGEVVTYGYDGERYL